MGAFAVFVASLGGVGYAPVAPGTVGTLVVVPLFPVAARIQAAWPAGYVAFLGVAITGAIWAAHVAGRALGEVDSSRIVIDEAVGYLVTTAFLDFSWAAAASAFCLFRLFDILKPFPVSWVERRLGGGLGVVADDVVAGALAGLVASVLLERWIA
jgi:phosphatidylglycerophosphatase A